jgi:hypothetical protein
MSTRDLIFDSPFEPTAVKAAAVRAVQAAVSLLLADCVHCFLTRAMVEVL